MSGDAAGRSVGKIGVNDTFSASFFGAQDASRQARDDHDVTVHAALRALVASSLSTLIVSTRPYSFKKLDSGL